jgi:hypothetical protein
MPLAPARARGAHDGLPRIGRSLQRGVNSALLLARPWQRHNKPGVDCSHRLLDGGCWCELRELNPVAAHLERT